jgi:SHS2 domain-containing protein
MASTQARSSVRPGWQHLENSEGTRLRAEGPTPDSAFEEAARALNAMLTDPDRIRPQEVVSFEIEATDLEDMLRRWLEALAREMTVRRMVFGRFLVRIDGDRLTARAWGERVDHLQHGGSALVRACHLSAIHVRHDTRTDCWQAECVACLRRGRPSLVPQ